METYRTPTAGVLLYFCRGDEVLGALVFLSFVVFRLFNDSRYRRYETEIFMGEEEDKKP